MTAATQTGKCVYTQFNAWTRKKWNAFLSLSSLKSLLYAPLCCIKTEFMREMTHSELFGLAWTEKKRMCTMYVSMAYHNAKIRIGNVRASGENKIHPTAFFRLRLKCGKNTTPLIKQHIRSYAYVYIMLLRNIHSSVSVNSLPIHLKWYTQLQWSECFVFEWFTYRNRVIQFHRFSVICVLGTAVVAVVTSAQKKYNLFSPFRVQKFLFFLRTKLDWNGKFLEIIFSQF